MEVTRAGQPVDLSAREFKLLRHFIERRGATLSRDALLSEVWGYDEMPLTRTVDVHVAGLRQKIESNPKSPEHILTIHGLGYKFAADGPSPWPRYNWSLRAKPSGFDTLLSRP
jgi:two-component system alkaline phosphatase synthesis response regulator PhoP